MEETDRAGTVMTGEEWSVADDEARMAHIRAGGILTREQAQELLKLIERDLVEETEKIKGNKTRSDLRRRAELIVAKGPDVSEEVRNLIESGQTEVALAQQETEYAWIDVQVIEKRQQRLNELAEMMEAVRRQLAEWEQQVTAPKRRQPLVPLGSRDGQLRIASDRIAKAAVESLMPGAMRLASEVESALDALSARGLSAGQRMWAAYPFTAKHIDGAIGFTETPGEAVWKMLQRNGALAVKAQYALWARAYEETEAQPNKFITLSIPQFCDDLGFKRKKRAHTKESKQAAMKVLKLLTSLEVVMLWQTPQGKTRRVQSQLWHRGAVAEELDGYADLFGASRIGDPDLWEPIAFAYAPGFFFGDEEWRKYNKNVALIGEGLLQLGTDNADKWAVLIGGFLAIQIRMNGWRPLKRKVGRVLAATGLLDEMKKHRKPGRMRDKLEGALERLKEVGVIKDFEFTSGPEDLDLDDMNSTETLNSLAEPARWVGAWLEECVVVEWPDECSQREIKLQAHRQRQVDVIGPQQKRKSGRPKKSNDDLSTK
jgi:hypothetical protein